MPSSRENRASQLPVIGGDDPSVQHHKLSTQSMILSALLQKSEVSIIFFWQVIYVRPGYEANLDSLVQDTIRLTTYAKVRFSLNYFQIS